LEKSNGYGIGYLYSWIPLFLEGAMESGRKLLRLPIATFFAMVILFSSLLAFAGGGGHVALGQYANPMIGISPDPGFYFTEYLSYYTADELKDNHGRTLSLARNGVELERSSAYASGNSILWISNLKILGGLYGARFVVPVERLNTMTDALTSFGSKYLSEGAGGVGDIYFNPIILSWHEKHGLFHITTGVDITAPTGSYNEKRMISIGRNLWTFTPAFQFTTFFPWYPKISVGIRVDYSFNTSNDKFIINPATAAKIGNTALTGLKTHLTPGQEFHFDYGIGYFLTKLDAAHQFQVGIVGYYYQQVTDDKTGEGRVKDDRGRVFSIGPGLWYNHNRWNIGLQGFIETGAKNRTQGWLGLSTITYSFKK
jgi:hypothetical protein